MELLKWPALFLAGYVLVCIIIGSSVMTISCLTAPVACRREGDVAPGVRRRHLRSWLLECIQQSWTALFVLLPKREVAFRFNGRGRWIVLIPGYMENGQSMLLLAIRLNRATGRPVAALNIKPWMFTSIKRHAEMAGKTIDRLAGSTGTVDLVGHSMGGLVARYWIEKMGGAERTGTVVLMGTPNTGTTAASLAPGACASEMMPGSEFIREMMESAMTPPANVGYHTICSATDAIATPRGNAMLPFGGCMWTGDYGHEGLLLGSKIADAVIARLDDGCTA